MRLLDDTRVTRLLDRLCGTAEFGPIEIAEPPPDPDGRPLLIGRSPRCDLVLGDPSVSRKHAELVREDDRWLVRDLSSTNGTRVNGWRIHRAVVARGDELTLGGQRLVFGRRP
jgi:pSer/pThr/pTyr-binding forkhead associated (FHA) protein